MPNLISEQAIVEKIKIIYSQNIQKLEFLLDMWRGSIAWYSPLEGITDFYKAKAYLPKYTKETDKQYLDRVCRATFDRKFRDGIQTTAGFLSDFILKDDTDESIKNSLDNIDNAGNSLKNLLKQADQKALRDEHCFILVDFPKTPVNNDGQPLINNRVEERQFNLKPYLVLIDTRQVINWEHSRYNNGIQYLKKIVIKEAMPENNDDFEKQNSEGCRYRVLYPGKYEIWEKKGTEAPIIVEEGFTTSEEIPIIYYSLTDDAVDIDNNDPFGGEPPLYDLAELNLKLYRKESEKDNIITKVNLPVFVIREINPTKRHPNDPLPSVDIGPNSFLYNVEGSVLEPSGAAISQAQEDINKLKNEIDKKVFSFQSGTYTPATATEVNQMSSANKARLEGMAAAKESAVQKIFYFWNLWMGGNGKGGSIEINRKMLQSGIDTAQANLLLALRKDGELSRQAMFDLLKKGKMLPADFNIEAELKKINDDLSLDVQQKTASIHDIYLKYQVVDPDEVAESLVTGKPLSEVINLKKRQEEQESVQQQTIEGFIND